MTPAMFFIPLNRKLVKSGRGSGMRAGSMRSTFAVALLACCAIHCTSPAIPYAAGGQAGGCIGEAHEKFGKSIALKSFCRSPSDCEYQAPLLNASALALVNTMAETIQECWRKAGLTLAEQTRASATLSTRRYADPTGKSGESCEIALSETSGALADGFRAACRTLPAR